MAAAVESRLPENLFDFPDEGWKPEDCTDRQVQDLVIQFFKALCEDARSRVERAKRGELILDRGFWYPSEHMTLLRKQGDLGSIEKCKVMRENGDFIHALPPKGFDRVESDESPTGISPGHYKLKEGVLPCDALDEMLPRKNTRAFLMDCGMLVQLAHYSALRVIFGKEKFNAHCPLVFHPEIPEPLLSFCDLREDSDPPNPGDNCFFRNAPFYHRKHRYGNCCVLHVICVAEGKYEGFGLPKPESSERDIFSLFADEVNKEPIFAKQILPAKLASEQPPLHPLDQMITTYHRRIEWLAKEYPEKVGLASLKVRLSSEKIKTALVS